MSFAGARAEVVSQNSTSRKVTLLVCPYDGSIANLGGNQRERYARGSFKDGLDQNPCVLWDHDPRKMLGRRAVGTARFWETAAGLYAECEAPSTSYADDLLVLLRRGDVNGASAGMFIIDWTYEADVRVIRKAILVEASVASLPLYANTSARIATAATMPALAAAEARLTELYRPRTVPALEAAARRLAEIDAGIASLHAASTGSMAEAERRLRSLLK
jgi:HK97 family phage prohead protease